MPLHRPWKDMYHTALLGSPTRIITSSALSKIGLDMPLPPLSELVRAQTRKRWCSLSAIRRLGRLGHRTLASVQINASYEVQCPVRYIYMDTLILSTDSARTAERTTYGHIALADLPWSFCFITRRRCLQPPKLPYRRNTAARYGSPRSQTCELSAACAEVIIINESKTHMHYSIPVQDIRFISPSYRHTTYNPSQEHCPEEGRKRDLSCLTTLARFNTR